MGRFVPFTCCAVSLLVTVAVRPNNDAPKAEAHGRAVASTLPAQSASVNKTTSPAKVAASPPSSQRSEPVNNTKIQTAALKNKTEPNVQEVEQVFEPMEQALGTSEKLILPADATEEEIEKEGLKAGSTKDQQAQEEKILTGLESGTLGAGVDKLTLAVNDPRAFLLELPGMQHFVNGLRVAIDLQPKELEGICLQSGRFKGFGCSKLESERPICQCAGTFENCWVDDHASIVATFNSGKNAEAFERAKSLLFGQCYTPRWLVVVFGGGVTLVVLSVGVFLYFFTRQPKSDDSSFDLPSFPSIASAIAIIRLRISGT